VRPRPRVSLAVVMLSLLAGVPAVALPAGTPPPDDPFAPLLRGLADSTDAFFGRTAVAFDTTGIDSLIRARAAGRPVGPEGKRISVRFLPRLGFHRATGRVVGAGARVGDDDRGWVELRGGYEFADREGRYRASVVRALYGQGPGRDRGRLSLGGSYARETVLFASEHAETWESTFAALTTGRDRQGVFERRGAEAELRWDSATLLGTVGWRAARDQPMPLRTRFSLWGADRDVPPVTPARRGAYREGYLELAWDRHGSLHLGAEARYAQRHRWRARLAGAQRLGFAGFALNLQAEAGLAAHGGPTQDRFELGGPVAVPSLPLSAEAGNRLVLGKVELLHGLDLLRALRVPHPSFLVLHPGLFLQEGAAWDGADGSWSPPPSGSRRGAAGISLVHLPGMPSPATFVRLQVAWPVERKGGAARFSLALGRWHDLAPRR
jgi:hypothetical protein